MYRNEHPTLAITYSSLGVLYLEQNKFKDAETQFLKAIALEEKT